MSAIVHRHTLAVHGPTCAVHTGDTTDELVALRLAMQKICDAVGTDRPARVAECFRMMENELFKQRAEIKRLNGIISGKPCPHCDGTGKVAANEPA